MFTFYPTIYLSKIFWCVPALLWEKVLCDPTPTSRQGEGEGTCRCFSAERAASNFYHFVWMDIGRIVSFSDDIVSFVGMLQIHHPSISRIVIEHPRISGGLKGWSTSLLRWVFLQLPRWVVPSSGTTSVMIQSPKSQVWKDRFGKRKFRKFVRVFPKGMSWVVSYNQARLDALVSSCWIVILLSYCWWFRDPAPVDKENIRIFITFFFRVS